jgi:hypothetical protein
VSPHIQDERTDEQIAELEEWACANYGNVSVRFTEGIKGRTRRRYLVSVDGAPEKNLLSVTTICDSHFSKDGLTWWYEHTTIDGVSAILADLLLEVGATPELTADAIKGIRRMADPEKLAGALYAMGLTPTQVKEAAGIDGSILHKAVEDWFNHGQVPDLSLVPPDKRGKMQALAGFLSDVRPTLIASEPPIVSTRYGYAGRPDLIAEVDRHIPVKIQPTTKKEDVRDGWISPGICLFDFKSGNKIWQDHGVQLAMYEQGMAECNFPDIEWRIVVHLRDEGYVLHAFPDMRSLVPHLMALSTGYKSLNRQKAQLNKSLLVEPEPAEAVA